MLFERQRLLLTLLDAVGEPVGHKQQRILVTVETCLPLSCKLGASGDCCCWARPEKLCASRE
jgi:hypothetical protein